LAAGGRHERAIELLLSPIARGDDDGRYSRVQLAEVYFNQGADADAYDQSAREAVVHGG